MRHRAAVDRVREPEGPLALLGGQDHVVPTTSGGRADQREHHPVETRVVVLVTGPQLLGPQHASRQPVRGAGVVELEGADGRQPRVVRQDVLGQLGEQPPYGAPGMSEHVRPGSCHRDPAEHLPVAAGQGLAETLVELPVLGEPQRRLGVQAGHQGRVLGLQTLPAQLLDESVVAVPAAMVVEGDQRYAGGLQALERLGPTGRPGEVLGQARVHALDDAGQEEEAP